LVVPGIGTIQGFCALSRIKAAPSAPARFPLKATFETLIDQHLSKDGTCDGTCQAFYNAFDFGLNLGARIAAEPMRIPPIQDLIDEYRFKESAGGRVIRFF
jgi:hypothetical protein